MTITSWITAAALVICVGWLAAVERIPEPASAALLAAQQDAAATASRDWAARRACEGRPFEWLDDKTLVCHREVRP